MCLIVSVFYGWGIFVIRLFYLPYSVQYMMFTILCLVLTVGPPGLERTGPGIADTDGGGEGKRAEDRPISATDGGIV